MHEYAFDVYNPEWWYVVYAWLPMSQHVARQSKSKQSWFVSAIKYQLSSQRLCSCTQIKK